jgi:hypothetical protein
MSTYFHQFVLCAALLLLIVRVPGLNGWFLPAQLPFLVAVGAIIQAGFLLLAVWARRHLGRNWSAEVRIAVDHELVRYGAVSVAAASHLYRDAGHVPRNGDSFEPVSCAARIGDIGDRLSTKNATGRSDAGPGFWR